MLYSKKSIIIVLFIITLLIPTITYSQLIKHFGIKSGISNSWQTYEAWEYGETKNSGNKMGPNFSVYADWLDNSFFSFITEINYSSKGMKAPYLTGYIIEEEKLNYLSFAILPNVYTNLGNIKIYALVGPRIEFLVSSSINTNAPIYIHNEIIDEFNKYEKTSYGLLIGIGFKLNNIFPVIIGIEARYNKDLSNLYEVSYLKIKNNSIDLLLTAEI